MSLTTRLSVSGMSCAGCIASAENSLNGVAGVTNATINFAEHTAIIQGDVATAALIKALQSAGYDGTVMSGTEYSAIIISWRFCLAWIPAHAGMGGLKLNTYANRNGK